MDVDDRALSLMEAVAEMMMMMQASPLVTKILSSFIMLSVVCTPHTEIAPGGTRVCVCVACLERESKDGDSPFAFAVCCGDDVDEISPREDEEGRISPFSF